MSEEFEIPPELAILESELGAIPVAASRANRDQLLYQSGWAAAMNTQLSTPARVATRNGWAWPTATAVFASLATMLAVMFYQQNSTMDPDRSAPNVVAESDATDKDSQPVAENGFKVAGATQNPTSSYQQFGPTFRNAAWSSADAGLTVRSRINPDNWMTVAVYETEGAVEGDSKSTLELFREMVPTTASQSESNPSLLDWLSQKLGDAL